MNGPVLFQPLIPLLPLLGFLLNGVLGRRFPRTQFFITGVLGPHSNAHGPNEFLDVGYAKKLTACVSMVLADHARSPCVA